MTITQQRRNQEWRNGALVADNTVDVDVTAEATESDLRAKARAALAVNAAFLALPSPSNVQTVTQVQRLTRECSALIRLLIGADLLVENADT